MCVIPIDEVIMRFTQHEYKKNVNFVKQDAIINSRLDKPFNDRFEFQNCPVLFSSVIQFSTKTCNCCIYFSLFFCTPRVEFEYLKENISPGTKLMLKILFRYTSLNLLRSLFL